MNPKAEEMIGAAMKKEAEAIPPKERECNILDIAKMAIKMADGRERTTKELAGHLGLSTHKTNSICERLKTLGVLDKTRIRFGAGKENVATAWRSAQ